MAHPLLALWASPRTVSTAFERMMIERGDHLVFDEPFSVPYYLGPARRSDRFDELPDASTPDEVAAELEAAADAQPVFVKDMAYHVAPWIDTALLRRSTNTFLIRDPAWALPSLARKWPDFTDDEAGYEAQGHLFDRAQAVGDVVVVDSDDLRADPPAVVAAWCERVGIPFLAGTLTWSPGMQDEWIHWRDWYEDVATSTGFQPPASGPPPPLDSDRLRSSVATCRPIYDRLRAHRLTP